jgi:hypothetical protein
MFKVIEVGLAAAALAMTSTMALAEGQPWACQFTASAGLKWTNGRWETKSIILGAPFVLVVENGVITRESAAKAMGYSDYSHFFSCVDTGRETLFCSGLASTDVLIFNRYNGRGGISNLQGAMDTGKVRDTPMVSAFTCQKY